MHVDHIKPKSRYPHLALKFDNLQVLCETCNIEKSNIDETDYR
jgi:5-methylcytosine-specific restriction endonuclease McrA